MNLEDVKRYNQGFGSFGPMEQCNGGKWVKYEDYHHLLFRYQRVVGKLYDCTNTLQRERDAVFLLKVALAVAVPGWFVAMGLIIKEYAL